MTLATPNETSTMTDPSPSPTVVNLTQLEEVVRVARKREDTMAATGHGTDSVQIHLHDEHATKGVLRVVLLSNEGGHVVDEFTVDTGQAPGETGRATAINEEDAEIDRVWNSHFGDVKLAVPTAAEAVSLIVDTAVNSGESLLPGIEAALESVLHIDGLPAHRIIEAARREAYGQVERYDLRPEDPRPLIVDRYERAFLRRLLDDPFTYATSRLNTPEAEHTEQMLADEEHRSELLNRLGNDPESTCRVCDAPMQPTADGLCPTCTTTAEQHDEALDPTRRRYVDAQKVDPWPGDQKCEGTSVAHSMAAMKWAFTVDDIGAHIDRLRAEAELYRFNPAALATQRYETAVRALEDERDQQAEAAEAARARAQLLDAMHAFKQATANLNEAWERAGEPDILGDSYGQLPSFDELAFAVAGWEVPKA